MNNITMFERLNMELVDCMENNKTVKIHYYFNGVVIRNTIIPNEIQMDENEIYIESDNAFQMEINKDIDSINYDEMENSYCIKADSMETYFDF